MLQKGPDGAITADDRGMSPQGETGKGSENLRNLPGLFIT